ncbi:MAG: pyruvate kinase alpha/beta domain-containing protein, partial [Pseudomonadales bacterium]
YSLARKPEALRYLSLVRGTFTYLANIDENFSVAESIQASLQLLKDAGSLATGDRILLTVGDSIGTSGQTNTLKVLEV